MLSMLDGPEYLERVAVNNVKNVRSAKKAIRKAFQNQIDGKGFSLIEVISACPTNWGMTPSKALKWIDDNISISDQDKQTLLKYSVREVSLTGAGTLAVNFSQADPFVGTYALNGTRIAFSFDASDIPFITSGQFSGTVTFREVSSPSTKNSLL